MPRLPRVILPGGIFHVTLRGNNRQQIFQDGADYRRYLVELGQGLQEYSCDLLAYALMPNHVHLVLKDHQALLSRLMQVFNAGFTRYFNKRHTRVGHLYQGRFHATLVDRDAYLLEVTRYVHLNPVRAGLVGRPEEYPWSSYRVYIGAERATEQPFLKPTFVWSLISANATEQPLRYRGFVETASVSDTFSLKSV
jgi:REP element-mobilizing transposase RayT